MIQVKLFHAFAEYPRQDSKKELKQMEDEMNAFLRTLEDGQVKKIYVAIDSAEKMGLVEYKVNTNNNAI